MRQARIEECLRVAFLPELLRVENESHNHSVPNGSETHFKVVIVSPKFESLSRVARHQLVYGALGPELQTGLHALSIVAKTPQEWSTSSDVAPSPLCHTKAKAGS